MYPVWREGQEVKAVTATGNPNGIQTAPPTAGPDSGGMIEVMPVDGQSETKAA